MFTSVNRCVSHRYFALAAWSDRSYPQKEATVPKDALTYKALTQAITGQAAAIRCRSRLQPAAGPGTKVFPPTHSGGAYATEQRRISDSAKPGDPAKPGETRLADCVLLDSVQSQANRIEDALQQAIDDGRLSMPLIVVDFSGVEGISDIPRVTSLQAPHRAADAILRDSLTHEKDDKGKPIPFRQSTVGKAITKSSLANATGLYRYCPHALVLGVWDSTGPKKNGSKFARALVSEVVGIDACYGVRTGSRIDPTQIMKNAGPLFQKDVQKFGGIEWTLNEKEAKVDKSDKPLLFSRSDSGKPGDPSKANHSNIPPSISSAGGATISHAEHTAVLSLPQLRRLRFPLDGKMDVNVDNAARTVLASLALVGLTLALEQGSDLRSRCLLVLESSITFELLDVQDGTPVTQHFTLNSQQAIEIYNKAVVQAAQLKLVWDPNPVVLKPSPELTALVKKSQELAAAGISDESEN